MANNTKKTSTRTFNKVQVTTDKGILRLQFPNKLVKSIASQGIKFSRYKSLGKRETEADTGLSNRPWAEALASRMQADIDHPDGLFDPTLAKYLDVKLDATTAVVVQSASELLTVGQVWESFLGYHLPGKSAATKHRYQKGCGSKLKPFWNAPINRGTANDMRAAFLEKPCSANKLAMQLLKKAVDWAIDEEKIFIAKNPFNGIAEGLPGGEKRVNKVTGLPSDYVAFTQDEVKIILDAYLAHSLNRKHHDFFKFKFLTGCRTGEAIALTWNDIKLEEKVILFNKTYSQKSGLSLGTKTEKCRLFPINSYLADWLSSLKMISSSDIVFPGKTSKYINRSTLSHGWSDDSQTGTAKKDGIVVSLAKQGKLQYLPPYNTRHTFINFCVDRGIDTITIADWCGNSDNVIEQVYRSRKRDVDIELLPQF